MFYQGEEIGMTNAGFTDIGQYRDVESTNYYRILLDRGLSESEALEILARRSRDNGRTPMQWTAGEHAGFSSAEPWLGIPENYQKINAETEEADPDSILHYYRTLVKLRKEEPIIAEGGIRFLDTGNERVFAYERSYNDLILTVICSFSFSHEAISGELARRLETGRILIGNYGENDKLQGTESVLRPFEAAVVKCSVI